MLNKTIWDSIYEIVDSEIDEMIDGLGLGEEVPWGCRDITATQITEKVISRIVSELQR